MKWAVLALALALAGCEAERVDAIARAERQMYLLRTCVEKGGFPETTIGQEFKRCHWPEDRKKE